MWRALAYRNYRLFFSGQLVSLMGTWMTQIATTWLVYRLTHSTVMLGAVSFAGQIPSFLLSPIAGVWVDRWPRHRIILCTQVLAMTQSFALAALALSGRIQLWEILLLMMFQGLINAFDIPARQAFVLEMVENKADLANAIALNASMFNLARLVGPAVGGLLIAAVGEGWCFLLDGFSYLAVLAGLLMMVVKPSVIKQTHDHPLRSLREGFAYTAGFIPIRSLLLLMAGMSLVGMPYAVLMPVIADKVLHGGPHILGFLMGAAGLGALAGALGMAGRKSIRGLGTVIPMCTAGFGVALIILGISPWFWLSMPVLFVMGACLMTQNASCNTIVQTIVDPDKRGRVMSFYTMAFMGMAPFGSLLAGGLAGRIGVQYTLMLCGLGSLALCGWFVLNLPSLRTALRPVYLELGIIAPQALALGVEEATLLGSPPTREG